MHTQSVFNSSLNLLEKYHKNLTISLYPAILPPINDYKRQLWAYFQPKSGKF